MVRDSSSVGFVVVVVVVTLVDAALTIYHLYRVPPRPHYFVTGFVFVAAVAGCLVVAVTATDFAAFVQLLLRRLCCCFGVLRCHQVKRVHRFPPLLLFFSSSTPLSPSSFSSSSSSSSRNDQKREVVLEGTRAETLPLLLLLLLLLPTTSSSSSSEDDRSE